MRNAEQGVADISLVRALRAELPNILLVDSDPATASQLSAWFRGGAQASLVHASDIVAATQIMRERDWDVIVIDPAMPGGFEFLRQTKSLSHWLAALVVTANQSPDFMQLAVQCRIDGLLFKPLDGVSFAKQVLALAEETRTRRRKQQKRVFAIGAHPDDIELGCGGALAKHRSAGDEVYMLTLSRGSAGGDAHVRVREGSNAADLLGAEVEFGDLPDGHIPEGSEAIELIEAAIRKFRPTHVYTHSLEDTHQDHRATHTATMSAARTIPNIYCYQSPSSTVEFRPNRFVDISNVIGTKLSAIACHRSQVARSASLREDVILTTARYWGRYAGYVMAEPICIVRQRAGVAGLGIGVGHASTTGPGWGEPNEARRSNGEFSADQFGNNPLRTCL